MALRLVQPEYTVATSDGMRNGTREMRYSLIGREVTHDTVCEHLSASGLEGTIAVVACDKPPVGTLAGVLEHNRPAILMSDGPIRPGRDSASEQPIDIISAFQIAGHADDDYKQRIAREACPGYGSVRRHVHLQHHADLHRGSSACSRCTWWPHHRTIRVGWTAFRPSWSTICTGLIERGDTPRDIVGRDAIRNAVIVALAIGGSTNVLLHAPEIARAAGFGSFSDDIMSPEEFNHLSQHVVPVLTDARPYGVYSMVDIDEKGGIQVIVRALLDAGMLNGDMLTCTGETLAEQVSRLDAAEPDGAVVYPVSAPYKPTGGLRVLGGNLSPEHSAVLKLAGVEGGLDDNRFVGRARIFNGEQDLLDTLQSRPDSFADHDMVIVRYEGPSGAPGMPEMLDSTSRITTLCREREIIVGLMTDGRFSGGSVGLVIGHVGPEAFLGGPIALVEDGDEIVVDLNANVLNCTALDDPDTVESRRAAWRHVVQDNGGAHPLGGEVNSRLLNRMRRSAVSAVYGAGMHPDRELWVPEARQATRSGFVPKNRYREGCEKAF